MDDTSVLMTYALAGDADLSGIIDGDDFFAIDAGFAGLASGFSNGDFDYGTRVDADDYFVIDSNYSKAVSAAPVAPVLAGAELPAAWKPAESRRQDDVLAAIL